MTPEHNEALVQAMARAIAGAEYPSWASREGYQILTDAKWVEHAAQARAALTAHDTYMREEEPF